MKFPQYVHSEVEKEILSFWQSQKIVEKLREKRKEGKKFYFLEGPPYTSGRIHIGHAWNMALKDMILRYKRMQGLNVWDRMGYDMHGLPTERKVMAKFDLQYKEDIQDFGLAKFSEECEKFCLEMMESMDEDFQRLGSTLDFSDSYQPVKTSFMDGVWWLIKKAHEKGRLYEGLRTMPWDAATQTAVAKHELEYKRVQDTSIYVKFQSADDPEKYFVIWTTTPWTMPLNLAIMVNPSLTYVDVRVGNEIWVLAEDLVETVMEKVGLDFTILESYSGRELVGKKYVHALHPEEFFPEDLKENKKLFSVLLSEEYVDTSAGTGLVHCAPGCGPEDYEVGYQNKLPPFNCVDEKGFFQDLGKYSGWKARTDDAKFIEALDESGALVAKEAYLHDYPHGERSQEAVIFRTTKQWFFKVEDLKEKMLKANEKIAWQPESAKNAFRSWLENLRDNSITKQRYWGTPVPIWKSEDGDVLVVGSLEELEGLYGKKIEKMHLPWIDDVVLEKGGKKYKRIPDVLDVWVDAGSASWNCLDFPREEKLFKEWFPADLILEGKDQVRGWFNLLMVGSFLGFDVPSFKQVYMHGFVADVDGVKMSKSLGNVISPYELIEKHGADVLRYYMMRTNAGSDINFSWDECKVKSRQLHIFWNLHRLLINLGKELDVNPFSLKFKDVEKHLDVEEKYMLSFASSRLKEVCSLMDAYRLDEVLVPLENLFLELSRTYIQMVRDKSASGSLEDKKVVLYVLRESFFEALKLFQCVAPFISEAMYLNLKEAFSLEEESISYFSCPKVNEKLIDASLEEKMAVAKVLIQSGLHAREKAKLGVRWPVKEVVLSGDASVQEVVKTFETVLKRQLNCRAVRVSSDSLGENFISSEYSLGSLEGSVSLDTELSPALELEGFGREVGRRVQSLRRKSGLQKADRVRLVVSSEYSLEGVKDDLAEKVGADALSFASVDACEFTDSFKVKGKEFSIGFDKV